MPERISLYPQNTVGKNALFFARLKRQNVNEVERQLKRVGLYHLPLEAIYHSVARHRTPEEVLA
jgi:ABC-type multidrug transport system ATPase subunit